MTTTAMTITMTAEKVAKMLAVSYQYRISNEEYAAKRDAVRLLLTDDEYDAVCEILESLVSNNK